MQVSGVLALCWGEISLCFIIPYAKMLFKLFLSTVSATPLSRNEECDGGGYSEIYRVVYKRGDRGESTENNADKKDEEDEDE